LLRRVLVRHDFIRDIPLGRCCLPCSARLQCNPRNCQSQFVLSDTKSFGDVTQCGALDVSLRTSALE